MLRERAPEAGPTTDLMRKAYARWAPVYDVVYDKLTEPAARAAVQAAVAHGPRVLEAGVGTGLSLGYYPRDSFVCGVDLSEDMLKRAGRKVARRGLSHVKGLQVMDVCRLGYKDASFDAVVAQFLITLVPDPEAALTEFLRVVRPGGGIVLANHFGQSNGRSPRRGDRRSALHQDRLVLGLQGDPDRGLGPSQRRRGGGPRPDLPGGFFKILRMRKPG